MRFSVAFGEVLLFVHVAFGFLWLPVFLDRYDVAVELSGYVLPRNQSSVVLSVVLSRCRSLGYQVLFY